jgi:hypothetical protein
LKVEGTDSDDHRAYGHTMTNARPITLLIGTVP